MSRYLVKSISCGKTVGTFTSVSAAYEAAEQFFQNNLQENIDEVRSSLTACGLVYVKSCFGGESILLIEKA